MPGASDKPDPYAASFIKEKLGDRKWHIFTSRLAESRKSGQKSKSRATRRLTNESNDPDTTNDGTGGASAVDFLVKVEVVKGVLRAFVPWVAFLLTLWLEVFIYFREPNICEFTCPNCS